MVADQRAPARPSPLLWLNRAYGRVTSSDMLRSSGMRVATLPLSAATGLFAGRSIVEHQGTVAFATYATLVALPGLIPFADLGIGGSLVTAIASGRAHNPDEAIRATTSAFFWTSLCGTGLGLVGLILYLLHASTGVLGLAPSSDNRLALFSAILLFSLGMPIGLSARIALGLRKNHVVVFCQSLGAVSGSVGVLLCASAQAPLWLLVALSLSGLILGNVGVTLYLASRWPRRCWQGVRNLTQAPRIPQFPRSSLVMLVIAISLPLAYQTDRIVLNHVTHGLRATAVYSTVIQAYNPCFAILSAAGAVLWPILSGSSSNLSMAKLRHLQRRMLILGLGGGCCVLLGGPIVSRLVLGSVSGSVSVAACFAALLIIHAAFYPLGMAMLTKRGLLVQALCSAAMLLVNLPASILLARWVGACGPPLASAMSIVVCMYLPADKFCQRRASMREEPL